jgi:hypothetical protein
MDHNDVSPKPYPPGVVRLVELSEQPIVQDGFGITGCVTGLPSLASSPEDGVLHMGPWRGTERQQRESKPRPAGPNYLPAKIPVRSVRTRK